MLEGLSHLGTPEFEQAQKATVKELIKAINKKKEISRNGIFTNWNAALDESIKEIEKYFGK